MDVENISLKKASALYCSSTKIMLLFLILGLNNARIPNCAPAAHMSTGSTGGGGGRENLLYFAMVGTACIGGGIYVRKIQQSMHASKDTSAEPGMSC